MYQSQGERFVHAVIGNIDWQGKTAMTVSDKGFTADNGATIFIDALPDGLTINKGDLLVKGAVYDDVKLSRELHSKYTVITVLAIKHCESITGRLDHWEVTGK